MRINATDGETARIRIARAAAAKLYPYLAAPLFSMVLVEDEAVGTAQINERLVLRFSPGFTAGLSDRQLVALVLHEVHHWVREHTGPRGEDHLRAVAAKLGEDFPWKRSQDLCNLAEDLEINDDLPEPDLPPNVFLPQKLGLPRGLLAEAYSDLLLNRLPEGSLERVLEGFVPDVGRGGGQEGSEEEGNEEARGLGLGPGMAAALRHQVAVEVVEHSRGRGSVPLGLLRWALERVEPRVSWQHLLRQEVRRGLITLREKRFPTYSLPHRRAEALKPFLLPGGYGYRPKVACIVDTSGSIDERQLAQAVAEVRAAARTGAEVSLYAVDAAVHLVRRVAPGQEVGALPGGGGTDMGRGIEQAVKDGHDLVVVLTDGDTPWPAKPPRVRVVVVLLGSGTAKPPAWARVIQVSVE